MTAELDSASATFDAVLTGLDEAGSRLEELTDEHLAGAVRRLAQRTQESGQALAVLQDDVAAELVAAADGTGNEPGDPVRIRIARLREHGHAPQRHGAQVTERELTDRALWGIDPMTGTTTDGENGTQHRCGRNATKFTSTAS
ncbi:hypothetical protein KIH74_06325 [Kineosporia sp. J2-2]|uniref:Uncharacterized protein n=1 Tax=Kineosporia corallincola TaxID=2835133 RepID=A0ABS5TCF6_9ACTN|nr:hypothetical protein [Kineosporia corallincola]MBT0768533.1 hypothetical protein [Kineosporia corallincola]